MNFLVYTLFVAGLAYSTSHPQPAQQQQCTPGESVNVMLGMSYRFFEQDILPTRPREQWPKVCGEETIKCKSDGKYDKCINDTWVEHECPCPGMNCGSGFQSHTCNGIVRS